MYFCVSFFIQTQTVDPHHVMKRIVCAITESEGFNTYIDISKWKEIQHDPVFCRALPNTFWSRDKQNVEDNLSIFSKEVKNYHMAKGNTNETTFCRQFRRVFAVFDERGLKTTTRIKFIQDFLEYFYLKSYRSWFLQRG